MVKESPYHHRAALAIVLAAFMFASMAAAVRYAAPTMPSEMLVFLRNLFGLVFLLPWLCRMGTQGLATTRLAGHLGRSITGLAAMYCFFYAIAYLPLAEAVLLNFTSPLFTVIIAILWLKEQATKPIMLAITVGFLGIAAILKPNLEFFSYAALVGLISGCLAAMAMVSIRSLSSTEPTRRIVFYFSLVATLLSAIPMPWLWQTPNLQALLAMLFAGLVATLGQLLLTYGYSLAAASRVATYSYSTILFAAAYGWIAWSETPDLLTICGAVLIVCAGMMTLTNSK